MPLPERFVDQRDAAALRDAPVRSIFDAPFEERSMKPDPTIESFLEINFVVDGLEERKALRVVNDLVRRIPVEMSEPKQLFRVKPGRLEFACVKVFGDLPEPLLIQKTLDLVFEIADRWEVSRIMRYAGGAMQFDGHTTSAKSPATRQMLVSFHAGMRRCDSPGEQWGDAT